MIMEVLGCDMYTVFKRIWPFFDIKKVCCIGIKLLNVVQFLHEKCVIYLEPPGMTDFIFGKGKEDPVTDNLYAIDFGETEFYRDDKGHYKVPWSETSVL